MSKTKFTPGPWNVDPQYIHDIQAGGVEVSRCTSYSNAGREAIYPYNAPCDEQADANAHLIAAAPDLYEALQELVDSIEPIAYPYHVSGLDNAKRVLARARGEQPQPKPASNAVEVEYSPADDLLDDLHANAPTPYDP